MENIACTSCPLDRMAHFREDTDWLADRLSETGTQLIPVWRHRNFIQCQQAVPFTLIIGSNPFTEKVLQQAGELIFLGLKQQTAVFAVDLSPLTEVELQATIRQWNCAGEFVDLRIYTALMDGAEAALLAYARAMVFWHQQHQYCGRCAHMTFSRDAGHRRVCGDDSCAQDIYPHTDPAVIMLVESHFSTGQPQCLLGRQASWQDGVYSVLAGYVEPGESLEEAVAREGYEEVGIKVEKICYQASQPWPFPASIMLGFWASALPGEIVVDNNELEDARWFSLDQLLNAGDWHDETALLRLSRADSIAYCLLESWLDQFR